MPGARVRRSWARPDGHVVTELGQYSTGVISDAMHRLGAMDGGIRAVWAEARLAGPALTVWVRAGDNARIHEAIALAEPGDVLVVNAQGAMTHAVFGELMALACKARGVVGIVVDGAIRDAAALFAMGFPVFARGACASGPLKDGTGEVGYPIAGGGVVCVSGDLVVADADGVVVVPSSDAVLVLERCREIDAWERQCRADLSARPTMPLGADPA
jgi:regulator of RNase E activity RraA